MALCIISAVCFLAVFGCHLKLSINQDYCGYMESPISAAVPWICGFILAVIPESIAFEIKWYWMFLINIPCAVIIGTIGASIFTRILTGNDYGSSGGILLIIAIITMIIGLSII